jgi:signal transduction histidine kinase
MVQILPIGLIVWQNNRLQHENLDRANDLNEQLLISRAELAASRRRVVHAGDIERRRIERDLHDGAQQRLVTLGVRLRLLESQTEDMPDVHHAVEDMIGELSAAIDEVRELSNGIYPPMLQSEGLVHALGEVARRSTTPVRTSLTHIERLDPSVETALYFTALEALTNTAKHAPGSLVDLRLVDEGSSLRLTVSDNGPGFEIDESKALASVNRLDDRVAAIGGTLTITSAIGKGTTVTAIVSKTDAIVPGTERSDQRV